MLLIFPVSYEFETTLTPKRLARKLDGELTEFKPTLNIFSTGKFMKKNKMNCLYYGRREAEKFQVFYHQAKRRDGGETGFYGHYEKSENGTKIRGKFRKPVYTYVFGAVWTVVTLFLALMLYALKQNTGAVVMLCAFAIGIFLLFWDSKKKYLRAYLDTFPRVESTEDKSDDIENSNDTAEH